jgi:hypothetical protein
MLPRSFSYALAVAVLFCGGHASAQTVGGQLSSLLTDQTPPPAGYVRDVDAARATFSTVAGLFLVELTAIPVASSSGGFVYRFNPALATVERSSDSFGPFFSERVLRNGRKQLSVGISYQFAQFETLQGADLTEGSFPTNTARFIGQLQPFSVDTLSLAIETRTVTAFASYGITDRLDVGTAIPITRLQFSGQRVNTFQGRSTLQSTQSGSSSGLGDMIASARFRLTGQSTSGLAVGTDVRFPTGRSEDLLGTGKTAGRFMGIASMEHERLAGHVNGGFGVGGVSRELFWSGAVTFVATPTVSFVGEVMGRRLNQLNRVADVYQPHPVLAGIETMRWLPTEGGVHTAYLVTGFKWNIGGSWLLNGHLLTRITDAGLRARFTPSIAIDRAIEF